MSALRRPGWLLAVLLTGQFIANVDTAIVNVAAPSIRETLRANTGQLELIVSGYTLAFAMLLITGARLGETHGHRRVFLLGLTSFTAASLLCGLAPNAAVLIGARILQGAGAGLVVPQVLTGIQQQFTGKSRARALAYYAMALSGGAVFGQVLGGVLVSANLLGTSWRPIFLINLPIGIAAILIGLRALPAARANHEHRLDLRGVAILSLTLLLLVVPLMFGRSLHWPLWTWLSLAASCPALLLFLRVQGRTAQPLLNLSMFRISPVRWALAAQAAATGSYFTLLFTLALYLQQGQGHSALFSGLALVTWVAAFGVAGPVLTRLPAERVPGFAPYGCLLLAIAYGAVSLSTATNPGNTVLLVILLGFGGLGLGLSFSSLIRHLTASVPASAAADLSGTTVTLFQLAGVVGVASLGTLYQALAPNGGIEASRTAFTVTTACFAALALLATLAARRATRIRPTTPAETRQAVPAVR